MSEEASRVEQLVSDWRTFLQRHTHLRDVDLNCIRKHPDWPWATPFHYPDRAPCPTCMEKGEPWNCPFQPGMYPFTAWRVTAVVPAQRLTASLAKDLSRGRRLQPE